MKIFFAIYVVGENHVQEGIISEIDNDECLGDNIFQKLLRFAARLSGMSEYSKLIGEINLDSLMYLPMLFYN